jgi:hypothetical protein
MRRLGGMIEIGMWEGVNGGDPRLRVSLQDGADLTARITSIAAISRVAEGPEHG